MPLDSAPSSMRPLRGEAIPFPTAVRSPIAAKRGTNITQLETRPRGTKKATSPAQAKRRG